MSSSAPNAQRYQLNSSRRPASIAELAERALDNLWDENKDLKHYLRVAEKYRRDGKDYVKKGDIENAFVEFARAATLVLEKLPSHRDYHTLLTTAQRHNLGLNGQDILDNLSELKPRLVDRHEKWLAQHPDGLDKDRAVDSRPQRTSNNTQTGATVSKSQVASYQNDDRTQNSDREAQEQRRLVAEEVARWRQQREETLRREEAERAERDRRNGRTPAQIDKRKEVAVAAARQAAVVHQPTEPDYAFSRTPVQSASFASHIAVSPTDGRRADNTGRYQQQEDARRREEEAGRRIAEQKRLQEQEGIVKRQLEAEDAARTVRQTIASNNPAVTPSATSSTSSITTGSSPSPMFPIATPSSLASTPASSFYHTPSSINYPTAGPSPLTSTLRAPTAIRSRPPSFLGQYSDVPSIMPLESPTRYEGDSTDSESVVRHLVDYRRGSKHKQVVDNSKTPTRGPARSPSYPPPITTTSPPPVEGGRILYPQLMSPHQKTQGYYPSLNSMFVPSDQHQPYTIPSSLLFSPNRSGGGQSLYPTNILPQPSIPIYPFAMPQGPGNPSQHTSLYPPPPPPPQHSSYAGKPPPIPPPPPTQPDPQPKQNGADRITRVSSHQTKDGPTLKTVSMPRECLPRFLAIARVNTAMNRETCGLLLGKDKGHKYAVTTLLIPKQHSTSDTCTMDEEELVLQFTEERSLITLGWIHTHPSQSCFMSSVDLHTHSGFQRMLPESFAVVCAPKSQPNFGIFRLTDPPGLQTVLQCNAKEAFHPHPDLPIYTDADKGHVQMKDSSLEIVDLR